MNQHHDRQTLPVVVSFAARHIPVVIDSQRPTQRQATARHTVRHCRRDDYKVLVDVQKQVVMLPRSTGTVPPTLYVPNAAAITKPHAIEHLAVDLTSYQVDVAIITETHLKKKHADHCFTINSYSLFRRDRVGRRGGGVAVYVNSRSAADVWTGPGDQHLFELLWVRVQVHPNDVIVGAVYHPLKPLYRPAELLDYIEACVDALTYEFPSATVILAGDFNTLDNSEVELAAQHDVFYRQPADARNEHTRSNIC